MKQEERRQYTIRLLLDTVKGLVQEKGCNSITMKDIMERSGLSKGAIFHYVRSKDEIFVWILRERLEETNEQFVSEVEQGHLTFEEPMQRIADSITAYGNARDVTNKVLMYLLGKESQPMIADALTQYYERSVDLSRQWIESGKQHGVIKETVDTNTAAEMFTLLTLGLRIRAAIPYTPTAFSAQDLSSFISDILKSR